VNLSGRIDKHLGMVDLRKLPQPQELSAAAISSEKGYSIQVAHHESKKIAALPCAVNRSKKICFP